MARKNAFSRTERKLKRALEKDIPDEIARVGLDHFKSSFEMQRYNEPGHAPWKEVKRRQRDSKWYGFQYGNKTKRPKKYGGGRNYSAAATTRAILFGQGSAGLRDSIFVKRKSAKGVVWASSSEHASIHNKGGRFKVFGKHAATMPKRQFMGTGTRLMGKIRRVVRKGLKNAMK